MNIPFSVSRLSADNKECFVQIKIMKNQKLLMNGFGVQQRETMPLEVFLAEYYLEDGDLYSMDNFAPTAPGSTWNYSNIATSLAAYLVEAATGTPFKEYVTTNILQPLGMTKTAYDLAEKVHDTIVEFIQNN